MQTLIQPTQVQQSIECEFDIQFTSIPNIWVKVSLSMRELFEVIKTGLIKNQPVSKIQLLEITQDKDEIVFVYDIEAVKQGIPAWSLLAKVSASHT
jgi:hypothetical protein